MRKVAVPLGVATVTVQRVKAEMAAVFFAQDHAQG
jgi:hypothetical protein